MANGIPSFFSLEFHTRFFPRLIWSYLQPKKKDEGGVRFVRGADFIIMLFLCLFLSALGIPLVVKGSWIGWILSILGVGGILLMLIFGILSQLGTKPSYDNFLILVFFFFIFLGISAGMFVGKAQHSLFLGLLSSALGLFFGYIIGIFAGLWFQYLGWFAPIVNILFGLAIFFTAVVDLVLLLR